MIAQELAIRHPERVRSLTSLMSSTGDPSLPEAAIDRARSIPGAELLLVEGSE